MFDLNCGLLLNFNFWSALSGLSGTVPIFFFGLPPKIDPDGHIHLICEQEDVNEKKKAKKYKAISYFGLSLIGCNFFFQLVGTILTLK